MTPDKQGTTNLEQPAMTANRAVELGTEPETTASGGRSVDSSPAPSSGPGRGQRFRPDIEGLRAIAVGLVLLFHGFGSPVTGGFVGVDIFFVISGFLITSLLLAEQQKKGRISISRFYARRVRRILPASALVVVVTVVASYYFLGFISGNDVAAAAKWTSVFAANIHFGIVQTDYFGSQMPPSPLQHMWSLGVEEQFYVVWPGLFLLLVLVVRGARHRNALAAALLLVIGASFWWSVVQTVSNPTWAYFSPLTRAWELALGALVAVLAPTIGRLSAGWPSQLVALGGLIGIGSSAFLLNPSVPYPGSAVALPVISTALVIAAGCANDRTVVGRALSVRPMQWIGARSYSLYLWHWPLLIVAAQYVGDDLSRWQSTGLLVLAVIASALTYRLVENPVRRAPFLASRTGLSLAMGAALILGTVVVAQCFIALHNGTWNPF
jgi:peptidoglycan/LPS O-acetylase OafA/YrhL